MARSSSEKRSNLPSNKWNKMTSFQRPSRTLSASSTPSAAETGVWPRSLRSGEYLTFLCVLAILASVGKSSFLSKCKEWPARRGGKGHEHQVASGHRPLFFVGERPRRVGH